MARLKVRFELNRGRTGAPMEKLGEISKQAEKFLRALAKDLSVETRKGGWLALEFKNGSVSFDAEYQTDVPEGVAREFSRALSFITDFDPDTEGANGLVSEATLMEYARIGGMIDPDEVIGLGIYNGDSKKPKWRAITHLTMSQITSVLEAPIVSYGAVQGILHSWHMQAHHPYFHVRELATDHLVRCFYGSALHPRVAAATQEPATVVHVGGYLTLDRITKTITDMRADRLDKAEVLSGADFERFFGSAPELTGEVDTDEFVDSIRGDAE
jgi:hypothetical protein